MKCIEKVTGCALLLAMTNISFADNIIREEYDPKPMVEGNLLLSFNRSIDF